jgi:hypothetical protein
MAAAENVPQQAICGKAFFDSIDPQQRNPAFTHASAVGVDQKWAGDG